LYIWQNIRMQKRTEELQLDLSFFWYKRIIEIKLK
jgi:hypothetical protein